MPEDVIQSTSPTQEPAQVFNQEPNMSAYIRENMDRAFGGGQVNNEQQNNEAQPQQQAAPQPVLIPLDSFKEFGYESPDAIVNDIKEYKAWKANPPAPQIEPIKFENEESEKLFRVWQKGDKAAVRQYLNEQDRLEQFSAAEITEQNADDILKLDMQVKYKDLNLSQAEIDYKFNKQYGIPKEPVKGDLEDDTEYEIRRSAWQEQVNDIKMSKIIDAKLAKPNIIAAKSNLKFPELNNTVDEGYNQYLQQVELGKQIEAEDREAYKAFTPKSIETTAQFIDEANGVKVDYQYEPDVDGFNQAVEMAKNVDLFFKSFIGQDGKPNRKDFLEAMYWSKRENRQKAILEAIKQAKTETIISKLPDNTQGSFTRQPAQTQSNSWLDNEMNRAFQYVNGYQPRRVS